MSKALSLATIGLPIGSIDAYIWQVNQIPMLSAEAEQAYAQQYQKDGDLESARQLVLAHLRYVVKVARGYLGYGLALSDLIQEGNIGLMKAVKRFDPTMGVRLVTFAVHWIKAEMHEFILRNWRIVKIATTKAQRKLFFKLRQQKTRLGWFTDAEIQEVATDLGVSPKEVVQMEMRLNAADVAFDTSPQDEEDHALLPAHYIADPLADPAHLVSVERGEADNKERLYQVLETLDPRSYDILQQRWLNEDSKITLHDLAAQYGISAERVRQLEQQALKKLKQLIQAQ